MRPTLRGGAAGCKGRQARQAWAYTFPAAFCDFGATVGQLPEVALVPCQGSGDLAALARSNCFEVVPEEAHTLKAGAVVRILLS